MKLRTIFCSILLVTALVVPACTSTGYVVKEYKPDARQNAVEYSPEYPIAGSEDNRIYIGLVKRTIVNYTEYYLTVKYVGEKGSSIKNRRFRKGNTLLLDTGKKRLRLRAISSLNKRKKLADGRVEEHNQYRLSWSGLGVIGRAEEIKVKYHGRAALAAGYSFTGKDLENFRRFIKTYSQKHVRL